MKNSVRIILIGTGATFTIDCFTFLLSLLTQKGNGIVYIGRWVAYLFKGKVFHNTIIQTPSVPNEMLIGWITHYSIGILFAFVLVLVFGIKWLSKPTIEAALVIGTISLFFPVCLLQPALGFGIAFSQLPNALFLFIKLVLIHIVYAIGLYWSAMLIQHSKKNSSINSN